MNRVNVRVVQDFLHVALMGLVVGVVFSMVVTGLVFVLSGGARTQPPANVVHPAEALPMPVPESSVTGAFPHSS